jgi:hypothetical protein
MERTQNLDRPVLNFVIGLGGTGLEIINDILAIVNRFKLSGGNALEWFIIDTASLTGNDIKDFPFVAKEMSNRHVKVETFNSAKKLISQLKKNYPKTNIDKIFPENDYLHDEDSGNHNGAWEIRKIGYLSFLYHLLLPEQKNILDLIKERIDRDYEPGNFRSINIHFVSSMAGGTGSGMVTPFAFILKKFLEKHYTDRTIVKTYGYLATPDLIARGSRAAPESKTAFDANAYQVLSELNLFSKPHTKEWLINLGEERLNFALSKDDPNFFSTVFIFDLYNTQKLNLVGKGSIELYKPSFQMIAWSIYFWLNENEQFEQRIGNLTEGKHGSFFAGMGIQVYEFPYFTILHKLASEHMFHKFFKYFPIINIDNDAKVDLTQAKSSLNTVYDKQFQETTKGKQAKIYQNMLSGYKERKEIENIRTITPTIEVDDLNKEIGNFLKEHIEKVIKTSLNSKNKNLSYVIKYIAEIRKHIDDKIKLLERNISQSEKFLETKNKDYETVSKINKLYNYKKGDYFKYKYNLEIDYRYQNFLKTITNTLSETTEMFNDLYNIFNNKDPKLDPEYFNEKYFECPPPIYIFDYKSLNLDECVSELYTEILNSYSKGSRYGLEQEELEKELYSEIWKIFSSEKLNKIIEEVFQKVNIDRTTRWDLEHITKLKNQAYNELFLYIKEYVDSREKDHQIISKRNNLAKEINKDSPSKINYSFPFIKLRDIKNKHGSMNILSGDGLKIKKSDDVKVYNNFSNDFLVMCARIRPNLSLSDLDIDAYKNAYVEVCDIKKRKNKKWYKFIDEQFYQFDDDDKKET